MEAFTRFVVRVGMEDTDNHSIPNTVHPAGDTFDPMEDRLREKPMRVATIDTPIQAGEIIEAIRTAKGGNFATDPSQVTVLESLGLYIGALRRRRKLSLQEVSQSAGISRNLMLQIELGIASLDQVIDHLADIAGALDCEPGKLLAIIFERTSELLE